MEAQHDYANFFDNIPIEIIQKINNDCGKLIINYSHEGWVCDYLLRGFYIGAKNANIKLNNIIIILNAYNLEDKIKNFIKTHSIQEYPKVINYSYYLTASSKHLSNKYEKEAPKSIDELMGNSELSVESSRRRY